MLTLRELRKSDRTLYLKAGSCEPGCEMLCLDETSANIMWSLAFCGKGKRVTYVIEEEGEFCGYCSVESGDTPEIGICLLEKFQNRGIGSRSIKLLWEQISAERPQLGYFVARVELENEKSRRMFERLGARVLQSEESELMQNLRKLASEDSSLVDVLQGMKQFNNTVIRYAVSFEGGD